MGRAVLIVVDALQVPARFSGVGRQVLSIGRELHKLPEDLDLEVRCAADVRPLLARVFPARACFRTPTQRSRPRSLRIAYQQLAAPARDRPPMLLLALGDQGPVWGRVPVLLVVNDVRRFSNPETAARAEAAYYRLLVPRAVRHAARIVTISEFSKRELAAAFDAKLEVDVVADHPLPQVSEPLGGRAEGPFLIVSALRPYKGVETAIDALALLPTKERRELVLVGTTEGREDDVLRRAEQRGVRHLVKLEGWMDDAGLRRMYERCLATVNPSTYEGYGLPVAESLSYGLPTIASDIPPHREVGGAAPLYFRSGDASVLARHMHRVVESDVRASLAWRALERSHELASLGPTWSDVLLSTARGV
jgi:glycosyltransferase involved in cell wall biosynthesis